MKGIVLASVYFTQKWSVLASFNSFTMFHFIRFPLVSGFYKLLEIVMKISRKLNYFKVNLISSTTEVFFTDFHCIKDTSFFNSRAWHWMMFQPAVLAIWRSIKWITQIVEIVLSCFINLRWRYSVRMYLYVNYWQASPRINKSTIVFNIPRLWLEWNSIKMIWCLPVSNLFSLCQTSLCYAISK